MNKISSSTYDPLISVPNFLRGLGWTNTKAEPLHEKFGMLIFTTVIELNNYTVGHKKGATFIFTITSANIDRFQ